MAWTVRSLVEISQRVRGAFRQYLPGTDSALANNFVTVCGKVIAGLAFEYELRMDWLARQQRLTTAEGRFLELHCSDVGIYRKQASAAAGEIEGRGEPGTAYPSGIRFVSGGQTYVSTASATPAEDGTLVLVVAAESRGASGNRDPDGLLSLADPVLYPDLATEWNVGADGLGGGADVESDESLRARGLQRKRNPPGAGTLADYERIVLGVSGVTKAWAFRVPSAPGMVIVHFLFAGRENGIPTSADVEAVQAVIDAARLIRVDDSVAVAPIAYAVDVDIAGLDADTDAVRAAISQAIADMLLAKCRPGIVGDTFTLSRSWISEAISTATGEERHRLVSPSADIILTGGSYPVLGDISYA